MRFTTLSTSALLCLWLAAAGAAVAETPATNPAGDTPGDPRNGYPTSVIVDYALGCMLANGTTPEMLQKCSCSVDMVMAAIPYDEYVRVETLMRLQQMEGAGRNAVYKNAAWSNAAIARFKEVQADSTLRCF